MLETAIQFWNTLKGKTAQLIKELSQNCLRIERYDVSTAPSNGKIGVKQPFGKEIFISYSETASNVEVGDTVYVVWWNTMSNAKAWYFGEHSAFSWIKTLFTFKIPVKFEDEASFEENISGTNATFTGTASASSISAETIAITQSPSFNTYPYPYSGRCTRNAGGYLVSGKHVDVYLIINVPEAIQATETYIWMMTGMPTPKFGYAALSISKVNEDGLGNGAYNCCVGSSGELAIHFGQHGITANNKLVINGTYWKN